MSLVAATETYSRLTVGDGLVAQLPALLVSVSAGTVVTRVSSTDRRDLGTEITGQLLNHPRALTLGAVIMLGLAFIPGFPAPAFLALAAVFAIGSYLSHRRAAATAQAAADSARSNAEAQAKRAEPQKPATTGEVAKPSRLRVTACVGRELAQAVTLEAFGQSVTQMRQYLTADLGIEPPGIELFIDQRIEPSHFHVDLEGVPVIEGAIPSGHLLVEDDPVHLELLAVPFDVGPRIIGPQPALWVEQHHEPVLAGAG